MNACFSTTGLMQRFQLLFVVLVYSFFAIQQADAAQAVTSVAPHISAGLEIVPLEPRAEPYALRAESGKVNVRFSVRLTGKTKAKPPARVYLRRSDDRKNIAMNDQGRNGDLFARDGIYGANVTIDTSRLKPDTCLKYEALVRLGRAEAVSSPLRLCVSAFPVRVAASTTARADVLPDGTKAVADEILINVKPDSKSDEIRRLATDINARVVGSIPPLDFYQLKLSSPVSSSRLTELVTQLNARAEVKAASVNAIGGYAYTPNDPEFANQHGLKLAIAHDAGTGANVWDSGAIGTGVTVTVLDTGLDKSHPDFGTPGNCQLAENDCGAANTDTVGHGTWVAGVVAAKTNNALGVAGVAYGSKIHSIIVAGGTAPTIAQMTQGFTDAAAYGVASVINASFDVLVSTFTNVTTLCGSVNSAVLSGATPVAVVVNAADNYSSNSYYYPARCNVNEPAAPHVGQNEALTRKDLFITVANSTSGGACGSVDQLHSTSNYGAWVDIAAPGCDIRTTAVGGGYVSQTGTSFSAPMVSGAAAILKSCGATLAQIEPALKGSAIVAVPYPGGSAPRLDIYRALAQLDLAPTGVGPASSSLNENNAPGATVATLTATDTDTCDKLAFTLVAGAGDTDNGAFTITGNQLTINGVADYETKTGYSIRVRVTDAFGKTFEQALTVNVNNLNEPPVISNQSFSINENSSNGTVAGTVLATDPDAGDTLTYSIIGPNPGGFIINPSSGVITVGNSAALDYESVVSHSYTLNVQVTDSGALSASAVVTVNLNNVNEPPVINNQTFAIDENSANGTAVGTVVASDPDAGDTLTYSITGGNTGNAFAIDSGTGAISVNNTVALDYETTPTFNLTVRAADAGGLFASATVTINLNNLPESIPNPILVYDHKSTGVDGLGNTVDWYHFTVSNWNAYPAAMFAARPDLPPCGLNNSASRTWVDFYRTADNSRIYGFCALGTPADLNGIWIGMVPAGTPPPTSVYITLTDRGTGIVYTSNSVTVPFP